MFQIKSKTREHFIFRATPKNLIYFKDVSVFIVYFYRYIFLILLTMGHKLLLAFKLHKNYYCFRCLGKKNIR